MALCCISIVVSLLLFGFHLKIPKNKIILRPSDYISASAQSDGGVMQHLIKPIFIYFII